MDILLVTNTSVKSASKLKYILWLDVFIGNISDSQFYQ